MSIDNPPIRRSPRSGATAKLVHYDEYIDKQIRSTRRMVKVVDVATSLAMLATGVLAFLLVAAAVEHWLVPSGFSMGLRTALFVLRVGGAAYFAHRQLWPLCVRAINPIYAAQAIEQDHPSLKNSLINLLFFRKRRAEISEAVYKTLEEQAAQRLTRVPIDSAVNRTSLIRVGYVLLAVVAVAALYKVFSPKDPLIAAERLLLPWADVVPASRTQITAVAPGAATIARGDFLEVSAEVRGIGDDDEVLVRYTTADGRAVDKPVAMAAAQDGSTFTCRLPAGGDSTGAAGIAQDLTYRIEAGDARTLDYPVTVVAAPTILVERIDYDYPQYTDYTDVTEEANPVEGSAARPWADPGRIRAIEGTRVTIHSRANGPIDDAHIDFDADGRRDLSMTADGVHAKVQFELALRADRQTPKYLSYVLRFKTIDGRTNRNPVKHPIEVLPDYAPEVAIVTPQQEALDIGLNESVAIEVEARDPDFALQQVRLRGASTGRPGFDVLLLKTDHDGKFRGRFRFSPSAHDLRPGDEVEYWAEANDIRTPLPNSTATKRRIFRIKSPNLNQPPPPDRIAQRDQRQQPGNGKEGQPQEGGQGQQGGENQNGEGEAQPGASGQQPGGDRES
jgi:hypothetical protein